MKTTDCTKWGNIEGNSKIGRWKCLKHHSFLYFTLVEPPPNQSIQPMLPPTMSYKSCALDLKQLTPHKKFHVKQDIFMVCPFQWGENNPLIWTRVLGLGLFVGFFNSTSAFTIQLLNCIQSLDTKLLFQSLLIHHGDEFISNFTTGTEKMNPVLKLLPPDYGFFLIIFFF